MIQLKDKQYIDLALYIAKSFSKCKRAQYATVWIGAHGHLIGASWNGKPKNVECDGICFREDSFYTEREIPVPNTKPSCCLHAEDNGASWTDPINRIGGTVYVSGIPCDMCYFRLINSGVKRLVYLAESDISGHICNIVIPGGETAKYYENGTEIVIFTNDEWKKLYGDK